MSRRRFYYVENDAGERLPVWTNDVTIGSAPTNTLVVPEPSVAAIQTRVWRALDRCWIRDEGALYGTLVNGEPIEGDRELHPGDVVSVGTQAYRLVAGPAVLDSRSPGRTTGQRPPATTQASRALTATLAPILLLAVVLGATLIARKGHRETVVVDLRRALSDEQGDAHFQTSSGEQFSLKVWNEYDLPWSDVQVAYFAGASAEYSAFFSFYDDLLSGIALFPATPDGPLRDYPNLMFRANPDQIGAVTAFLLELDYGPNAYVDTVDFDVYADTGPPSYAVVRVSLYDDGLLFFGVQRGGLVSRFQYEGDDPVAAERWDRYELPFRDLSSGRTYDVVLYAASQAPAMSQVELVDAAQTGQVRVSLLATDRWTYPAYPGSVDVLADHTLSLGRTSDSDIEYHYRLLSSTGALAVEWAVAQQRAACTRDGCQPTEIVLDGLAPGSYTLEAYALDEVGNQSDTRQLALSIGQ